MDHSNSTTMDLKLSHWEKVLESVALVVVLVASSFLNITTCVIIAQNKLLRTRPANVFVANLCLSNMMLTLFVVPFSLATLLWDKHGAYSGPACTLNGFFSVTACSAIVLTLCCISIDRYIAVNKSTRYRTIMTTKRALYMLSFTWFESLLFALFPVFGWSHYEYHPGTLHCSPSFSSNCSLYIFLSIACFTIPIIIMLITYIKIFQVIRKHSRIVTSLKMTSHTPISPNAKTLVDELQGKWAQNQEQNQDSQSSSLPLHNERKETLLESDGCPPLSPSSIITTNNEDEQTLHFSVAQRDDVTRDYNTFEEMKPTEHLLACPIQGNNGSVIAIQKTSSASILSISSVKLPDGQSRRGRGVTFQKTQLNFCTRKKPKVKRTVPKEYKIAKTGLLLLVLFIILWLPYLVVNSCTTKIHAPERVFHFAMWLVYMNGVANPIAYAFNNSIVKAKLQQIFRKAFHPFSQ